MRYWNWTFASPATSWERCNDWCVPRIRNWHCTVGCPRDTFQSALDKPRRNWPVRSTLKDYRCRHEDRQVWRNRRETSGLGSRQCTHQETKYDEWHPNERRRSWWGCREEYERSIEGLAMSSAGTFPRWSTGQVRPHSTRSLKSSRFSTILLDSLRTIWAPDQCASLLKKLWW